MRDSGDKVPEDIKLAVEKAKIEIQEALKGDALASIKEKTQNFSIAAQKIGESLYKKDDNAQAGPTQVEHGDVKKDNSSDDAKS